MFEQQRTRRAMIALFLAVLEMVRMQAVVLAQKDLFGEIALQRHDNFDAVFASEQPIAGDRKRLHLISGMEELETPPQGVSPEHRTGAAAPADRRTRRRRQPRRSHPPRRRSCCADEPSRSTTLPARAGPPVEDVAAQGRPRSHHLRGREPLTLAQIAAALAAARGAHPRPARPAGRGIRPAGARPHHPRSGRRLQDGHQAGASRGRPHVSSRA